MQAFILNLILNRENIKWNLNISKDKIYALLVNTRNANAFTGKDGYKSLNNIALLLSELLSKKQINDEEEPKKIKIKIFYLLQLEYWRNFS